MQHQMFDQLCKKETCIAKNGQICNYYPACKMPHFHLSLKCSLKPEFGIFRPHLKIALKIVGLDFYTCICITCAQTKYDHIKGKNICGFYLMVHCIHIFFKKIGFWNLVLKIGIVRTWCYGFKGSLHSFYISVQSGFGSTEIEINGKRFNLLQHFCRTP